MHRIVQSCIIYGSSCDDDHHSNPRGLHTLGEALLRLHGAGWNSPVMGRSSRRPHRCVTEEEKEEEEAQEQETETKEEEEGAIKADLEELLSRTCTREGFPYRSQRQR